MAISVHTNRSALTALQSGIDARGDRPFPQASLALSGDAEKRGLGGNGDDPGLVAFLREGFSRARSRDAAARYSDSDAEADRRETGRSDPRRGILAGRRARRRASMPSGTRSRNKYARAT